jgi:hypothetical protein
MVDSYREISSPGNSLPIRNPERGERKRLVGGGENYVMKNMIIGNPHLVSLEKLN